MAGIREFSREERLERACLRVAMVIRGMWEEKGDSDSRLFDWLIPDDLTVVGRSHAYDGVGRREHVVPRKVIADECHKMLKAEQSDRALADYIKHHLRIVRISHEECQRLDQKLQLGLRQSMPTDWKIGDDVYARLTAAGIEWSPLPA